jgi:large subunit ribosomal protein L17
MKHLKKRRVLGRVKSQRESLMSGLASALFMHKKIETTLAKAKEMRPYTEKLITKAKVKNQTRIRLVNKKISKMASKELFEVIAPFYLERKGGYLRIIKKSFRKSDCASMALVELVDFPREESKKAQEDKKEGKKLDKGEKQSKPKNKLPQTKENVEVGREKAKKQREDKQLEESK